MENFDLAVDLVARVLRESEGIANGPIALREPLEARIAELEAHLLVMTEHATNKAGGYLAKDHPDVLRARELTK